jgi:hypothetical protein
MTLKFICQLVLLITEAAKERLLYFLNLTADFLLTFCCDLDCHDLHQAGKKKPPNKKCTGCSKFMRVDARSSISKWHTSLDAT